MNQAHADYRGTYLSTTIPYVNAPPHIGHALEIVQADTVARLLRLFGEDVWTSTGTDDHSLKNVRAADRLGLEPAVLVAQNARAFSTLVGVLEAEFDHVIATSQDRRHAPSVERLIDQCRQRGDLYRRHYRGLYCVGCEQFYRPEQWVDGVCQEHGTAPEVVEEENWFFRLSRYGSEIQRAIESGRLQILPESRQREVLGLIRRGLEDFSISRSAERARGFGLPVPGDPSQVVYVWVDALANYLTAGDFGALGTLAGWQQAARRVHLLGKGVLRFHAVHWPGLLLSAGLDLPDELRVHGYLTVEGKKIGKSLGNALDPVELIHGYGSTALRYYLLRHVPAFQDSDFSRERLIVAHDAELSDELGNLVSRVLSLLHRHRGGQVPDLGEVGAEEQELETIATNLSGRLRASAHRHELDAGLCAVWDLVRATNRCLDHAAPWRLVRDSDRVNQARFDTVLAACVGSLRVLAAAVAGFLPALGQCLAERVGAVCSAGTLLDTSAFRRARERGHVGTPDPLVPRLRQRSRP